MKIGIDVGGTNLAAGLVNDCGEIIFKEQCRTKADEGYEAVVSRITALAKSLIHSFNEQNAFTSESLKNVGIGIPGIISKDGKIVVSCPNLFWQNKPLKADLEEALLFPVHLSNDATVAGIAENRFGSTKGYDNAVMFTLGTGVGGAVILDGKVINGAHGVASEFGHMFVGKNDYDCNCGKNGCLETFSSATAIIRLARKLVIEGQKTDILDRAEGCLNTIDAEMVINAAKAGDRVGVLCFNSLIEHLSIAIANIGDILDPEIVTIGGGVANAGDFLRTRLMEAVYPKMTFKQIAVPEIVLATLKNDAGIVGAACIGEYLK
ncbi:MAG: ROK family protein [Eubacterium sp.]